MESKRGPTRHSSLDTHFQPAIEISSHEISDRAGPILGPQVYLAMMTIETQIDRDKGVRIHRITGEINLPEFQEGLRKMYESPDFNPDIHALWDVRQADFSKVAADDVRALMHVVTSSWGPDGKCRAAILVGGLAEYGLCRMYESQFGTAAPCKIKIFLDLPLAWKWVEASDDIAQGMTSRSLLT